MSMQNQLFAILTFPVTGIPGSIQIDFSMAMPGSNALIDNEMTTFAAMTVGGSAVVGQTGGAEAIPTLSEWGLIIFVAGLIISTLFLMRRQSPSI